MGRLFLKLYSILALSVVVYFVGVANLSSILQGTLERYFSSLANGTFYLLDKRLADTAPEQWPALVAEVNRGDGFTMRLLSTESLTLPPPMKTRLDRGEMVISEVYGASYSYKRIQDSEWVLEFPFEQSEYNHNQRLSSSTFNLIEMSLREQPQNRWPDVMTGLTQQFSFPVTLVDHKQVELPSPLQEQLVNGEIVWQDVDDDTDFLFRRIDSSPYAIKMGPFDEPLTLNYLQTILMLALALLVALAVLFWVYPLWRDLKRLDVSTRAFGQGDFSVRAPIARGSVLHLLAETFNGMADRIQGLISSHKELTNAVSHELRTPIARLRFGIEMLHSSANEADRARYMKGMNADIDELDQLVAELLTYARFDRDKPALKFQRQEVEPWLAEVVRQAKIGNGDLLIEYEVNGEAGKYARFEPLLMARALGNLLQNARRYAQTRVNVLFTHDDGHYQISVDDDGAGIPESERKGVFEAFKRLDASRDRDTGGYGLGLAIAQRISQWHGGEIATVDSPLGGARFVIRWPENDGLQKVN